MRFLTVVLAVASALVAGCGIGVQDEPRRLQARPPIPADGPGIPGATRTDVLVYFVDGGRLVAVSRPAQNRTATEALRLLVAGPTVEEVAQGVRTALAPQPLEVAGYLESGTVMVLATDVLTQVRGPNQLLALAQLVWTLTEVPGVTAVRILVDGDPIAVPADTGLTWEPVDREDYQLVAPATPTPTGPEPTPVEPTRTNGVPSSPPGQPRTPSETSPGSP